MLTHAEVATIRAVASGINGQASADDVARRLGIKHGRLAASAKLRSLNRRGFVGRIPPGDRWRCAIWFVTQEGWLAAEKAIQK